MPYAHADGVNLYYEDTGSGFPIVFVHEFAGDYRSWEPQIRFFARRYRCIAFNARGYPPSDVPLDPGAYSQDQATDDVATVMQAVGITKAHIVGISMGGFAALHFGLRYAEMAESITVAGAGYGARADQREQFESDSDALADEYERIGSEAMAEQYANGVYRLQFKAKDPRGWQQFKEMLAEHSATGSALTMRGVQKMRPSLWDLEDGLAAMAVPTLIVNGDEDDWCLDPGVFLKRTIPRAGLWVIPKTGHTINLEEPDLFNTGVAEFFAMVEAGRWAEKRFAPGASALLSGLGDNAESQA